MNTRGIVVVVSTLAITVSAATVAAAYNWPEIPEAEKTLLEVPGHPNAPAVVLLNAGYVHIDDKRLSSYIDVYTRIKILNEEGVAFGSMELDSSDYLRTKEISGRTHLPDGRIADLSKEAIFSKEFSDYYDTVIVSTALPEVVPGAIVEYHYRTYFDAMYFPREWTFQTDIPTLRSEVVFELPKTIAYYPIEFNRLGDGKLQRMIDQNVRGGRATYSMENVPAVADEPYSFPFDDLASKVLVLPAVDYSTRIPTHFFDTWESLLNIYFGVNDWGYAGFKKNAGTAKKQAKQLASGSRRETAEAIYNWVRDEIEIEPYVGIFLGERTADEVMSSGKGDFAEKPTLLKIMLDAAKIDAAIGWTNPRNAGMMTPAIANPRQFSSVIVVVDIDGERFFLDPTDRRNGFGVLDPALYGVDCMLVRSEKDTEWITTADLTPAESGRHATVDYVLDEDGALTGKGALELVGGSAWRRLRWKDTAEETTDAWTHAVEETYPGFDISDVTVEEDLSGPRVAVTWSMTQREEEILGDEVALAVAEPIARASNPFTLTPRQRTTPVQFDFASTDRVTTTIVWPEGWTIAAEPGLKNYSGSVGSLTTGRTVDPEARTATFEREFVVSVVQITSSRDYAKLRTLFQTTVANDTSALLLIAE